jgi:hypothetical protein
MAGDVSSDRLMDLFCRMCGEDMSPEEFARLENTLRTDPVARQRYYDFVELHGDLSWTFGKLGTKVPRIGSASRAIEETTLGDEPRPRPADGTYKTRSPVLGFLGGVLEQAVRSRNVMFWSICAVLASYFAMQLGSLLLTHLHDERADIAGAGSLHRSASNTADESAPADEGPAVGPIVAQLTNVFDCQWEVTRPADAQHSRPQSQLVELPTGARFRAGKRLNLVNGLAELTFTSGAKVILHAPAQFAVSGPLGGNLQRGKLTAKVQHNKSGGGKSEASAVGFTIATPSGKVVDLGTEFGVNVSDDRSMHVVVFVGEVEVNSPSGSATQSAGGGSSKPGIVKLKAGDAIAVAPGQPARTIAAADERFVRDLSTLGDRAAAEAAYIEFVKKLKPVVWFRMEGKDSDRTLRNEMGGPDAKLLWDGPGNPFVKGPVGKSLWLRGEALKDGATLTDYSKADHSKLTVTAWAYADAHRPWATVAKNWGGANLGGGQFSIELCAWDNNPCDMCARICQQDGNLVTVREGAQHPFPLYEWQHIAFVADGAALRLYRQGREVGSVAYASLKYPAPYKALGIGVRTGDDANDPSAGGTNYWSGKLDEVAVFNDALSAEQIKKLANWVPR